MFWLFFCMYIMFLGAEVSMWLETSSILVDVKNLRKKRKRRRLRKQQQRLLKKHSETSKKE